MGGRHPAAVDPIDLVGLPLLGGLLLAVAATAVVDPIDPVVDPIEMKLIDGEIGSEEHQGVTAGHREVEAHQAEEGPLGEGVRPAVVPLMTKKYTKTTRRIPNLMEWGPDPRTLVCLIAMTRMQRDTRNTFTKWMPCSRISMVIGGRRSNGRESFAGRPSAC